MAIRIPVTTQESLGALNVPGGVRMDTSGTRIAAQQGAATVDALGAAQARMQQQRDATMIFNTLAEFGDVERAQTTAWQERRGSAAHGLQDEASAWWGAEPTKFADKLETPQQRAMFQQEIAKRRASSLDSLANFQAQQERQGLLDATSNRIQLEVSTAAQNFMDPNAVSTARQGVLDTVDTLVYLNGGDKNVLEGERLKALTKLHVGVIENLNDVDPARAEEYFKEHRKEIDGTLHDDLRNKLEQGSKLEQAQTLVDELWTKGLRGTKLFDAVREKSHGKYEQDALTIARQRNSDNQAEVDRAKGQRVDSVYAKFDMGGFEALTANDIEFMRVNDMRGLTAMRNTDPQSQVLTDWTVNQELADQAMTDPNEFVKVDLRAYRDKLAKPQLDTLQSLQTSLAKQLETNKPDEVATLQQQITTSFDRYGMKSADDKGNFTQFVRERVSAAETARGKTLTFEERENLIKGAAYEFDLAWRRDRAGFELRPEDVSRIRIAPQDRAEVVRVLEARGMDTSDETVRAMYIRLATAGHFD